jgi:hypothetical protein
MRRYGGVESTQSLRPSRPRKIDGGRVDHLLGRSLPAGILRHRRFFTTGTLYLTGFFTTEDTESTEEQGAFAFNDASLFSEDFRTQLTREVIANRNYSPHRILHNANFFTAESTEG